MSRNFSGLSFHKLGSEDQIVILFLSQDATGFLDTRHSPTPLTFPSLNNLIDWMGEESLTRGILVWTVSKIFIRIHCNISSALNSVILLVFSKISIDQVYHQTCFSSCISYCHSLWLTGEKFSKNKPFNWIFESAQMKSLWRAETKRRSLAASQLDAPGLQWRVSNGVSI